MKDFIASPSESGHDHFFNSFFKFLEIVSESRPELLASVIQRAAEQNEFYLEIMILPDNARAASFGDSLNEASTLSLQRQYLLKNQDYLKNIQHTLEQTEAIYQKARTILGCNDKPDAKACQVHVRFQYYILREQPLPNFFAQALNAFEAAKQSDLIVGINLVQAEDGLLSLKNYSQQMKMLQWLKSQYPSVHIALHAGEQTIENVRPSDLRFHIREALFIGGAERIGHGVDIAHENDAHALVRHMAKNRIPVEINLTSNEKILGVKGNAHPLRYYLNHHVPVVLSTDDEGILRTDLTQEYVKAVIEHDLDYPTLKQINRNALTFSFLPGKSIWLNEERATLIPQCKQLNSQSCHTFIKKNTKARVQWQLEKALIIFEKNFTDSARTS